MKDIIADCGTTEEELRQVFTLLPDRISSTAELVKLLCNAESDPTKILAIVLAYTEPRIASTSFNAQKVQTIIEKLPEVRSVHELVLQFLAAPRDATVIAAMLIRYTPFLTIAYKETLTQ